MAAAAKGSESSVISGPTTVTFTFDTICAVATAPGGAARGIVRISGPETLAAVGACICANDGTALTDVRLPTTVPATLLLPAPLGAIDGELFLWPGARSYTRQPTAEFHTFGSPVILAAAVQEFCRHGARPAEPGEFTLRAFLAGRIDLTQAEAVLGVIDATEEKPLRRALDQLAGGVSRPLLELREQLLQLLAHLEAGLDFVEEDIEFISAAEIEQILAAALQEVGGLAEQMQARSVDNNRPRIVLIGLPNAGKSSLFNALLGNSAAIVSEQSGTTRDYLTADVNWQGLHLELIDTAGVTAEQGDHSISRAAQSATHEQQEAATIRLVCLDASRPLRKEESAWLDSADAATTICVLTKCDQPRQNNFSGQAIATSSATGQGIAELRLAIERAAGEAGLGDAVAGTAERCHDSLRLAADALGHCRSLNRQRAGDELVAAELRLALAELGKVVGAVYTDEILDRVFSRFCIGK